MTTPILTTKLYIPPPRPNLVPRWRLIEQLSAALTSKLTLVSAPAGFGKSTLLASWGKQVEAASIAWLSLDENDNDLVRFLTYFVAALQTINQEIGEGILTVLQSPGTPNSDIILTNLLNEITEHPDEIVLILDDYHVIDKKAINQILVFLLDHLPPNLHLIIATREDPLLSLSRLRARGQLTELRAADLRFTPAEAAEFLNQVMGLALSVEEISALEARTEGWITGLQMAALSMQGRADTSSFIQAFTGSHHFILDYLIEEVLQRQSEHVRNFLLETSILDRLCGSLCDAVTENVSRQQDGKAMLEALDRENLFVVPLDDQRLWYRYHHLFADVLRTRLQERQPDQIAALHQRASEWYEGQNLPADAIRHALVTEDFDRAADLAELAWPEWRESFYSITWLGWVRDLPDELVRTRPVLCVNYAWAHLNAGELEAAETRLQDAERWIDPSTPTQSRLDEVVIVDEEQLQELPIMLSAARTYHAQAIGDLPGTVKYAQQTLNLMPEGDHAERGTATALLGLSQWASGDIEAAHQTFADGLAEMKPLDVIIGTFVLAEMKMTLGFLHEAISTCEHALRLAAEHGKPMPIGTEDVYSGLSELHRETGDLEAAAQDLVNCKVLGEQVELPDWQYRYCVAQARLNESLGDPDGALELLDEAERVFVRTPLPIVRPIAAMKARVWIQQGRLPETLSWVREWGLSVDGELSYLHEFEHITLARALIAQHKDGSIDDAIRLLERLHQAAEEGKRIRSTIEILILQSLALAKKGDSSSALAPLKRALILAEPAGFVQTFVDEGPPMAQLLHEALSQGIAQDYVQRLLGASSINAPRQPEPSIFHISQSELVEPLSEREIEVLHLIAEGLTNQEIANRLYLSLHTVKVHAHNIYGKLGVKNRMQAVAKGKSLGILTSI